ncbi:LGFP repeat-containing protein [Arthrobacter sp. SLBN-112]|uniref:hypothetical protein n=1 Tax=Arthrobacter sp. SLBN-112 TaxID=2768452 RepID=UPI001151545F|nr:hypothetical protein [Arthrobacter sp. SLBN-112]TQJ40956.1 LGFP repeat-containing protein [Arthrobacter sp. SLBN-112]
MHQTKPLSLALVVIAIAGNAILGAGSAQAASQVNNPCQRLSAGQVKYNSFGATRVTFATATNRDSNVVTITGCVRSGNSYVQEWQDWGYAGLKGFAPPGLTWEDTFKSPTGSYSVTEALGRANPGTALVYHTVNANSRWGGEYGPTYNQYFEGSGGSSDENLYTYMNQGYYEQAAVINYNREPDMNTVQGASYAIFLHAGRTTSAGCLSTTLDVVNRFLRSNRPGDRIIMGAVDDIFTPYSSNPFGVIAEKYQQGGGPAGQLGSPSSNETGGLKDGGAFQNYQGGAIVWSPGSGAHFSWGATRDKWASLGFESGPLGYPVTDEVGGLRGGGVYQVYQGGVIMHSPASGARISAFGPIRDKWAETGFENGALGYPVSDVITGLKDGGSYQAYQNGAIFSSPASGTHAITAGINGKWRAQGAENGPLGYPTTDEVRGIRDGGSWQGFQGGAVLFSPASGAAISAGPIRDKWASTGFEWGALGYPVSDVVTGLKDGGAFQNYQGGAIILTPGVGPVLSVGSIRNVWASYGFEHGSLGYPITDEYGISGGVAQNYQGGVIHHLPNVGTYAVTGDIFTKHEEMGPTLGAAVSPQVAIKNGGLYQNFQRGSILWSPATGAHVSVGSTRGAWAQAGFENGYLGYPISDEIPVDGGVKQNYQGGTIFWSPRLGAYSMPSDFSSKFDAAGGLAALGFPGTNRVIGLKDGGSYVNFEKGALISSPATGVGLSTGKTRDAWAGTGFEWGRLGYPTTDNYVTADGSTAQDFQGGRITVPTGAPARIEYGSF